MIRYVFKNKNYIVSKQCMENNLWWRHSSRDSPWVLPRNSHVAYCYTNNHKASSHLVAMQMVGIISSKFLLNTCTCYILAINFEHLQTCLLSFIEMLRWQQHCKEFELPWEFLNQNYSSQSSTENGIQNASTMSDTSTILEFGFRQINHLFWAIPIQT